MKRNVISTRTLFLSLRHNNSLSHLLLIQDGDGQNAPLEVKEIDQCLMVGRARRRKLDPGRLERTTTTPISKLDC